MATIVANSAKAIFSNLVAGLGGTAPNFLAIGSGAGTAAVTDTTLFTEFTTGTWAGYARDNVTPTRTTTSQTNDTIRWQGTFTAPAAEAVTNAGMFDAANDLCVKGDFATINLANGDSLTLTVTLQFS